MAELKTKLNDGDVKAFLNTVENERKRNDSFEILELMQEAVGEEPKMWGDSIIGFGTYTYQYASGQKGDWPLAGFSPRKQNLTLYILTGFEQSDHLLSRLGKFKTGKSCLYIKTLDDVDKEVLKELVARSAAHVKETNPKC